MIEELKPSIKHFASSKEELAFNYLFLEYTSNYVLYHVEKAQAGCFMQQALVQRLQQLHGEFAMEKLSRCV